jgi:hypothetical protein
MSVLETRDFIPKFEIELRAGQIWHPRVVGRAQPEFSRACGGTPLFELAKWAGSGYRKCAKTGLRPRLNPQIPEIKPKLGQRNGPKPMPGIMVPGPMPIPRGYKL